MGCISAAVCFFCFFVRRVKCSVHEYVLVSCSRINNQKFPSLFFFFFFFWLIKKNKPRNKQTKNNSSCSTNRKTAINRTEMQQTLFKSVVKITIKRAAGYFSVQRQIIAVVCDAAETEEPVLTNTSKSMNC